MDFSEHSLPCNWCRAIAHRVMASPRRRERWQKETHRAWRNLFFVPCLEWAEGRKKLRAHMYVNWSCFIRVCRINVPRKTGKQFSPFLQSDKAQQKVARPFIPSCDRDLSFGLGTSSDSPGRAASGMMAEAALLSFFLYTYIYSRFLFRCYSHAAAFQFKYFSSSCISSEYRRVFFMFFK